MSLAISFPLFATAAKYSIEHSVVLFPGSRPEPISVDIATDGAAFVTLDGDNPTIAKLDKTGNVLWSFEIKRKIGISEQFLSAIPLPDGGAVACINRLSSPGTDLRVKYPGAAYRLDAQGKEVARFDVMEQPKEKWTFSGAVMCARWNDGFVFVATPYPFVSVPLYEMTGKEAVQKIVIRMNFDLVPTWTHVAPVYLTENIIGTRPSARVLSSGRLLLGGAGLFSIIDPEGTVIGVKQYDYGALVSDSSNSTVGHILAADLLPGPWQIVDVDDSLRQTKMQPLGKPANDYKMSAAILLRTGKVAVVGTKNQKDEILIFDALGKHVSTIPFPVRSPFSSDNDSISDIQPTDTGMVVLSETFSEKSGSAVLTWISVQ